LHAHAPNFCFPRFPKSSHPHYHLPPNTLLPTQRHKNFLPYDNGKVIQHAHGHSKLSQSRIQLKRILFRLNCRGIITSQTVIAPNSLYFVRQIFKDQNAASAAKSLSEALFKMVSQIPDGLEKQMFQQEMQVSGPGLIIVVLCKTIKGILYVV
jgi:hypothetical protein